MGLFSKKVDKEFDKLPELPQLPRSIIQSSTLPSMPQSESANRWSMQAVKDAVQETDPSEHLEHSENSHSLDDLDVSSGDKEVIGRPRIPVYNPQVPVRREPLFVRIDKFESAIRDFEDISIKIRRIDELITEIRQLREKEDREFSEWEKDLHLIKSRLDSIDRTLFSQLD